MKRPTKELLKDIEAANLEVTRVEKAKDGTTHIWVRRPLTTKPKFKKMKPYTRHWEACANVLLREAYGTPIACRACGHPVLTGYCCTNCGDTDPSSAEGD